MPLRAPFAERYPSPNRVRGWAAHALSHKGRGRCIEQLSANLFDRTRASMGADEFTAQTAIHIGTQSRGASRPSHASNMSLLKCRGRRECRVKASPMARLLKNAGGRYHRWCRSTGIPCATGLRLLRDLLGAPGLLATVIRVMHQHQRELDLSVGRPGPRDLTVRKRPFVRTSKGHAASSRGHRIPTSRVVTIARNAPLR